MSEFGLKIINIEASTLFEYNNGVRDHYEYKAAMLTNSLFTDYLRENGLKLWKEISTRDIICLTFNYGSRTYQKELDHLYGLAVAARQEYRTARLHKDVWLMEKAYKKRKKITDLLENAHKNRACYVEHSKEDIRKIFYNEGVNVEYISRNKTGEIKKREVIHYQMLYRSTGKAKKGACMFIRDRLYKKARNFLYMGIQPTQDHPMIVELSAYAPLVSSSIIGKLQIQPENILILKDIDRFFLTDVISVETDSARHCTARKIKNYRLKNTLFDGQALIDSRIFPDWGNGYLLLRHHFCKMAAFCSHIQDFFQDYFGEQYETAVVNDMFGQAHYVKDIDVITTDNAMKWLKFDKSYKDWCKKVHENNCMFGIVKTAHESKLGEVQKMSYQMVNSLDERRMEPVVKDSVDYVNRLKQDHQVFLEYLKRNSNYSNDYEVLIAICEQNPEFVRSTYFRRRKEYIIKSYIQNLKSGKLLQNAENLVIVGSPYAMLLYAATGSEASVDQDITFRPEPGTIQCYTERFGDGEYLAFFRSPFNSKNNLTYLHNVHSCLLKRYFSLGRQIIAVNLIGTDFQDRNNGSDQDSDAGYTTNQPDIVAHARSCYRDYPTIVNNIPMAKNFYPNTLDSYAAIDNGLASSQTDIGESSNLAQIAQTYACNYSDPKYTDYVCILSVLAQVAIDNAKRRFDIDLKNEIQRIKKDMDVTSNKYPSFWKIIKQNLRPSQINSKLHCPMNVLYSLNLNRFRDEEGTLPMSYFFQKYELDQNRKTCKRVEDLISKYSLTLYQFQGAERTTEQEEYLLLKSDFNDLIEDIRKTYLSQDYLGLISWLIDRAFLITPNLKRNQATVRSSINRNKSLLLKVLYEVNPSGLLKCFSKNCPF